MVRQLAPCVQRFALSAGDHYGPSPALGALLEAHAHLIFPGLDASEAKGLVPTLLDILGDRLAAQVFDRVQELLPARLAEP